ncbi:MAG: hypothetical protein GC185_09425 [Alphaproteobacteria bacterium]|nr:hypothetical protein [Alphaproteobacteria bacterium]
MMNEKLVAMPPGGGDGGGYGRGDRPSKGGALVSKNIRIHSRRTSVRLEPEMWDALSEIAGLEDCSIHDLCGAVHDLKDPGVSFTGALRVFLMEYYRAAARSNRQVSQVQKRLIAAKGDGGS